MAYDLMETDAARTGKSYARCWLRPSDTQPETELKPLPKPKKGRR